MFNNLKRVVILLVLTIAGFLGSIVSLLYKQDISIPLGISAFVASFFGSFLYSEFKNNDSNPI